jgi:glucokinase
MTEPIYTLGFDIGGTKTAWGVVGDDGVVKVRGQFPTPQQREELVKSLLKVIKDQKPTAIGIGIAGTVSADHQDIVVCPHIPELSHFELIQTIQKDYPIPVALDNDARCALIGEVWAGKAQDISSVVMITLGTGVGGAVMQKGVVLPHPHDITQEIGYTIADPSDLLPASTGRGSIESLLGGQNLEERFGIPMAELVAQARNEDPDAVETFKTISYYFIQSVRAIYDIYQCKLILVGGKGSKDLDLYLRDIPPCPVEAAELGEVAGVVGAARLGLDLYEQEQREAAEWGDEETSESVDE